ncbi:Cu-Zn family superoxide dismutase [Geomicrobium halophilum]|uniref:Superoxide dismutase [Cu-Zn] n=1 Tax=Geomicrobium halophilum TaxID=549000 RepID=A0A841PWJ9_9BACL|nr:superoxide dismutase family protein [Geomicrobium halophilum]MBB6448362.1 Cu-Zn family superoxide dismutase [Geomicrobium halophilum]
MKKRAFYLTLAGSISILLTACAPEDSGEQDSGAEENEVEDSTGEGNGNGEEEQGENQEANEPEAVADLQDENEEEVGTVRFFENGEGHTLVTAEAEGLEPGYHGFHIHEEGVCEADAEEGPFDSAEGHYAPEDNEHGGHAGDLPPLYVKEDGSAKMSVEVDRFTPDELVDDETAMMVHEDPDNFGHIPDRYQSEEQDESGPDEETLDTGDAGDRIACGVIEESA